MTEEPPSTSLEISVLTEDPLWAEELPNAEELARRFAVAAWSHAGNAEDSATCEATLVLAGDEQVADLNRRYRGRDGPTNVLSFADLDAPHPLPAGEARLLGDIVLARQTILCEAAAQGKDPADHLAHLVVHGLLHLLGHDHQSEAEAAAMETLERDILAGQGIADPYLSRSVSKAPAEATS